MAERRAPHREAHLALIAAFHGDGRIVMGGAVGDPPHAGLIVFRTAEAASAFVEADPYGEAGLVRQGDDRALDGRDVVSHWDAAGRAAAGGRGVHARRPQGRCGARDGYEAANVLVTLRGGGFEGAGEDPAPVAEQRDAYAGRRLRISTSRGRGRSASFAEHLQTVDQWRTYPAEWEMAVRWRNWSYESAALDLALQQAGEPLHAVLGSGAAAADVRELARARRPAVGGHDPAADRALPDRRLQARRRGGLDAGDHRRAGRHRDGPDDRLQGPLRHGGQGPGGAGGDVPAGASRPSRRRCSRTRTRSSST